jgi:hypothetical protein
MARGYTDSTLSRAFDDLFTIQGHEERQQQAHAPQFPKAEDIERTVREDLHLPHQKEFLDDVSHRILGLVAGFGAGKTRCLVGKAVLLAIANPGCLGLVLEPNNTMIRTLIVPEMTNRFQDWGVAYELKLSPLPEVKLYFDGFTSTLYLRSFENWNRIRGDNAAFALVDEIDTADKGSADKAWNLIQGRIRTGKVRQIGVVSTPEGFGLLYNIFVTNEAEDRRLIRAKTTDNYFLPPDYVESLRANYPSELIEAYINGEFVNLNTSAVYPDFSRTLNHSDRVALADDQLYLGMDFNIGKMSSVVFIKSGMWPVAVDEFTKLRDTAAMIAAIKQRYPEHFRQGKIWVYPDASGSASHTNASKSDIELLREARLKVNAPKSNPPIRDRILTVNTLILNAAGERRFMVNTTKCPQLLKTLEQQAYDDKEMPDKSNGLDHLGDAMGYFLHREYSFIHQRAGSGTKVMLY